MDSTEGTLHVAGRSFTPTEWQVVAQLVADGQGVSRTQLMDRVCQRLDWRRPTGSLKIRECRDLLERLVRLDRVRPLEQMLARVDDVPGKLIEQFGDPTGLRRRHVGVVVEVAQRQVGLGVAARVEFLFGGV